MSQFTAVQRRPLSVLLVAGAQPPPATATAIYQWNEVLFVKLVRMTTVAAMYVLRMGPAS
jgi:hypothetical protein